MPDFERRVFDFREHREYAPHLVSEESRVVEGYAIVFNQESRVQYDKASRKTFIEVIEPRAVTIDFLNAQDIKLNFNHNNDYILGRSCFGGGTLTFEIDEYGVKFRCELPNTTTGNDVLELIKRGDVWGCSFAFTYDKDGVVDEKRGGKNYRTIVKFGGIYDFAIVVDPAYWGTFAGVVATRAYSEPPAPEVGIPATQEMELLKLRGLL